MNEGDEFLIRRAGFFVSKLLDFDGEIVDMCVSTQLEEPDIDANDMFTTLLEFSKRFNNRNPTL